MPEVIFSHPALTERLVVDTGADQIVWSYGLNTANFPTYGGEVIQILSCYIEDITISGTTRRYAKLEQIYGWFVLYMKEATQVGHFDPRPVVMDYPERGWTFGITPKKLPGFKYARDVVAPTWTIQAAVAEADVQFHGTLLEDRLRHYIEHPDSGIELFGKATAEIGFTFDDPFSEHIEGAHHRPGSRRDEYDKLADYYNKLIPSYLDGDFTDLSAEYSRPSFLQQNSPNSRNEGTPEAQRQAGRRRANRDRNGRRRGSGG